MSRPKAEVPLIKKLAQSFAAIGKMPRAGTNRTRRYKYPRATDVFEAFRAELFKRDVLLTSDEEKAEYIPVGPSNGGEQITECRLVVAYTFRDAKEELGPFRKNGIGRDVDDKSIYKAQTGAQKALLKHFGLMAEDADDPEFDQDQAGETLDDVAPLKGTRREPKLVTENQIRAFHDACAQTGKTADEISTYLLTTHKVSELKELGRGRAFSAAIVWASDGHGTLGTLGDQPPKPQAVPDQRKLPLRTAPQSVEMKIGNQKIRFQPKDATTFSV